MQKLDTHQHFWDVHRFHYPWLSPAMTVLNRDYLPADLAPQLAACGIDGTVVVQAAHDAAETRWLLSLARQTPFIKGVVGWFDLTAPDLQAQVEAAMSDGPLCGVRHQVHDEPDRAWLLREPVLRGLRVLASLNLPYDLLVRPVHLPLLPQLFAAVPAGRWVIDHIAKPEIAAGAIQPWLDDLRRVAADDRVSCKLSGMVTEAGSHWSSETLRPYLDEVLAMFGPARLMFGSDWPVCRLAGARQATSLPQRGASGREPPAGARQATSLPQRGASGREPLAGSYEQVHDVIADFVAPLSPVEQAEIWSGTAHRVYALR